MSSLLRCLIVVAGCIGTLFLLGIAGNVTFAQEYPRPVLQAGAWQSDSHPVQPAWWQPPVDEIRRLAPVSHEQELPSLHSHTGDFHPDQQGDHHDDVHGDDHGGHGDHPEFDHIERGRIHRHETESGYPFIHLLKTEHAFLDPKTEVTFSTADGADGGTVDEYELEFEYFHIFSSRFGMILEVPVVGRDPVLGPGASGIGDLEVGLQWVAFNGHYNVLSFGLNVATPTGDRARELGSGHTKLEAVTYFWHDFGCGYVYQGEFKLEMPVSVADVENEFVYNMGISKTLLSTADWRMFRWLSPLIELNGVTALNGADSGKTVLNVSPGLRWIVRENDQVGLGFSFPVTGAQQYRSQLVVDYIRHF